MASDHYRKLYSFQNPSCDFLKVSSFGFLHFTDSRDTDFSKVNSWHALYYACGGKGTLTIHGKSYTLKRGTLYFIPPNAPFSLRCSKYEPMQYFYITLYAADAHKVSRILGFDEKPKSHRRSIPCFSLFWIKKQQRRKHTSKSCPY